MLNQASIIWNMTADPEIKETPNGHKVATFSIATNRKYKDGNGKKIEETDYHNIVCWQGLAEIVEKYAWKGKKLFVQWRMKTRSWEDANWVKRYKMEIIAESLELLGGPNKNAEYDQGDFPDDTQVAPEPKKRKAPPPGEEISIDDIPF